MIVAATLSTDKICDTTKKVQTHNVRSCHKSGGYDQVKTSKLPLLTFEDPPDQHRIRIGNIALSTSAAPLIQMQAGKTMKSREATVQLPAGPSISACVAQAKSWLLMDIWLSTPRSTSDVNERGDILCGVQEPLNFGPEPEFAIAMAHSKRSCIHSVFISQCHRRTVSSK